MINALLPEIVMRSLSRYDSRFIYELRLRRNCPIIMNYNGCNVALTNVDDEKIFANSTMIDYVLKSATEYSLYAYNNQIKQGFITTRGGVRLGVVGESVESDKFVPTTIKNISSINIRIPHQVEGCSKIAFKYMYNQETGIKNTLIIAPPGAGKTTLLRDVAKRLSEVDRVYNYLIVDERFEIAGVENGNVMLDVGVYADVISGASKIYAFTNAIRAMSPDVILTDELMGCEDVEACKRAINSGVKVVATVHADSYRDLMGKREFKEIFNGKFFDRYVILGSKNRPGKIESVLDESFNCIYF